jgi:hypothetical protein
MVGITLSGAERDTGSGPSKGGGVIEEGATDVARIFNFMFFHFEIFLIQ